MIVGRRIVGLVACVWLAASAALGDDEGDARWRCPNTQDGACIPNPRSYGYYPTRWRKWPAAKPAQETIPTPKPTQAESSTPEAPKENEELPPAETNPAATETPPEQAQPETTPPESMPEQPQTQPELPSELNNELPQPPDLENLLPEEGPEQPPAPPAKREPKTIPSEDDPFKDDPLPSEDKMEGAFAPASGAERHRANALAAGSASDAIHAKSNPQPSDRIGSRSADSRADFQTDLRSVQGGGGGSQSDEPGRNSGGVDFQKECPDRTCDGGDSQSDRRGRNSGGGDSQAGYPCRNRGACDPGQTNSIADQPAPIGHGRDGAALSGRRRRGGAGGPMVGGKYGAQNSGTVPSSAAAWRANPLRAAQ